MNALNYAKENPNSPFATELKTRIQSGQMNDQMKAAGIDPVKFVKQPTSTSTASLADRLSPSGGGGSVGNFASNVNKDLGSSANDLAHSVIDTPQRVQDLTKKTGSQAIGTGLALGESGLRAAGAVSGGLLSFANDAVRAIPGVDALLNHVGQGLSEQSAKNPDSLGMKIVNALNDFTTKHPEIAKDMGAITNIIGAVAGMKGAQEVGVKLPNAVQSVKDIASGAKDLTTGGKNLAINGLDSTKGLINGKTTEEILATPPENVYKLSAPERKYYFDNQQQQVNVARTIADQKISTDLQTKATASQAEAETLNRKLAVASRDEVVSLRPQIRAALSRQSQTYRNLVDEAIAPHIDTPVSATELKQFIESRFSNDTGMAEAVNSKLGLNEKTVAEPLKPGELPSTQVGEPIAHNGQFNQSQADTTIGKIYEKAKDLKQGIGSAATKGGRVYTVDEKLTDDSIHALSDFMKSKGVDLSEPNKFWAQYAPIRNQLVSEAKPFLQAPTQTKIFANTLTRVAKGTDVNNENFIKQVETLVGKPLATEQRNIVAKLGSNEKQQLANEVSAQEAKLQNKLQAELSSKKINEAEFEANRLAGRRKIIINVLKGIGGSIGVGEIIRHSPF